MEIKQIPLSLVFPSPMNPRKTFDEGELQELADNIEKQGLLQPITVRPVKHPTNEYGDRPDKYEIVCGERRFRAFSKLSEKWSAMDCVAPKGATYNRFSEITAIVREMTDDEAFDAMITENLQRKDVDPIEEAFAFGQLIKKGKTAEEVAARFGKSIRFVQDRVKLNNLIPELMLAVKDEKMSISAAMIISKLDEEEQRRFYSQYSNNYQGMTKSSAQNYVDNLFMTLDSSLWYKSDNQADEDFDGGCGRKCSECQFNTANHGCLFWEMKTEDAGKCTSRPDFQAKTLAYMMKEIDLIGDNLVKVGEPLEFGKTVLCIRESYLRDNTETKSIIAALKSMIAERGYEIVDPEKVFRSRCFYDEDDERTQDFLKKGQVYRCLNLFSWATPLLQYEQWYLQKGDNNTNVRDGGKPYRVTEILDTVKREENSLKYAYISSGAEALDKCVPSSDPLSEKEQTLMLSCMLTNNFGLCERIGMVTSQATDPRNLHKFVVDHPEKWAMMMRAWMFQQINGCHPNMIIAESMLDDLGNENCPEAYQAAKDKVLAKFNKSKSKAEKELAKLGYGLDGKRIKENSTQSGAVNIDKVYKEMKKQHPNSTLLFRVNDYYELYYEDAEKAAKVLDITITKRGKKMLAGFPHHALDTYLPKLAHAGLKVAVCEQLEDPKKTKKVKK